MVWSLSVLFLFVLSVVDAVDLNFTSDCVPNYDNFAIEFVLTQDVTVSYKRFLNELKEDLMPALVHEIERKHPGSKFGLTTFSDWPKRTYNQVDQCYSFYSELTTDVGGFLEKVKGAEMMFGGDLPETSLLGMSLSVTDARMNWSKEKVTQDGKRVLKVLAMATDAVSLTPEEIDFGDPFKGDATDSCKNTMPTPEEVGKVFRENDIFFLGLISGFSIKET